FFFFSSRRRHTRSKRDWSSDVCSSDLSFTDTLSASAMCPISYSKGSLTSNKYLFASTNWSASLMWYFVCVLLILLNHPPVFNTYKGIIAMLFQFVKYP